MCCNESTQSHDENSNVAIAWAMLSYRHNPESNHSLDLGGIGEDIAYPLALIECLLRSPSQLDVRTGGSQQKMTAHFAFSSITQRALFTEI